MKCKCKIKYVLGKEEALLLTTLFKLMGKEYSKYESFAKIKTETAQSLDCEFLRSWGFNYYCVKRDVITKFQES
jgi:hypothetical protein